MRLACPLLFALPLAALLAGCNTVAEADPDHVTIEHTSLRSRTAVYESAQKICSRQGRANAVFQSQVNQDPTRPPATGPQLSTFACR
ncbi:hypothetical protein [uncultured Xylophilus sp.]|uniref:hypothetical protein n=1 Tax=uncultured Xylophilus sp. TaxID=296832 RepID=UPI0025F4F6C1|nr:hypothetical protein [uncultured Xylophilus sp.]